MNWLMEQFRKKIEAGSVNWTAQGEFNMRGREDLSHIYITAPHIVACVIEPHEGNGYCFVLRVDNPDDFDRWSVCRIQESFNSPPEVLHRLMVLDCRYAHRAKNRQKGLHEEHE